MEFLWNGGHTARFHTVPTLKIDTVGHHSYNVACLLMTLRPDAPAHLLRAALKHDAAEHIVGDMPAPTKRALPDYHTVKFGPTEEVITFREAFGKLEEDTAAQYGVSLEEQGLTKEETWLLKLCDAMDGLRFCAQERRMGNRHTKLTEAGLNFASYVEKLLYGEGKYLKSPPVAFAQQQDIEMFRYLMGEWYSMGEWYEQR
jgi:5'-deoxynucleotidase YfbR-like HD superfamily hydrolase